MNEELSERLRPMAQIITQKLAIRPEHFITHPSEMKLFRALSDEDLRSFAHQNGWRIVRRIGGRRIEFYHDVHEQQERARTGNARPENERGLT